MNITTTFFEKKIKKIKKKNFPPINIKLTYVRSRQITRNGTSDNNIIELFGNCNKKTLTVISTKPEQIVKNSPSRKR